MFTAQKSDPEAGHVPVTSVHRLLSFKLNNFSRRFLRLRDRALCLITHVQSPDPGTSCSPGRGRAALGPDTADTPRGTPGTGSPRELPGQGRGACAFRPQVRALVPASGGGSSCPLF